MLRIPAWCEQGTKIEINGEPFDGAALPGSYAEIRRVWRRGDNVRLALPMPVRYEESHPYVAENAGRVALMRGPLLYCVDHVDNIIIKILDIVLPAEASFSVRFRPDLLGGVTVLSSQAEVRELPPEWAEPLYRTARSRTRAAPRGRQVELVAIPYYAWANREPGRMQVWMRTQDM